MSQGKGDANEFPGILAKKGSGYVEGHRTGLSGMRRILSISELSDLNSQPKTRTREKKENIPPRKNYGKRIQKMERIRRRMDKKMHPGNANCWR